MKVASNFAESTKVAGTRELVLQHSQQLLECFGSFRELIQSAQSEPETWDINLASFTIT